MSPERTISLALFIFSLSILFFEFFSLRLNFLPVFIFSAFAILFFYITDVRLMPKILFFIFFVLFAFALHNFHSSSFLSNVVCNGKNTQKDSEFLLKVLSVQDGKNYSKKIFAKVCSKSGDCSKALLFARLSKFEVLQSGEVLLAKLKFKDLDKMPTWYVNLLKSQKVRCVAEILSFTKSEQKSKLLYFASSAKRWFLDALKSSLPTEEYGLSAGLSLGQKTQMSDFWQEAFLKSGLTHIIVLSGFNMTVLSMTVFTLLAFAPNFLRVFASIALILFFILMVGASEPTVRAGIMGILSALAFYFKKENKIIYFLAFSAFLMLIYNPYLIAYSPSFQLSFIISFAIVVLAPELSERLQKFFKFKFLSDIVSSTLVAFVASFPLLSFYFHNVYITSIFANLLVLPFAGFAMILSLLAPMFRFVPFLGDFLNLILLLTLKYIFFVAFVFSEIFAISLPVQIPGLALVLVYVLFFIYLLSKMK